MNFENLGGQMVEGIKVIDMDLYHMTSQEKREMCENKPEIGYWGYGWEARQGQYNLNEVAEFGKENGFSTVLVEYLS